MPLENAKEGTPGFGRNIKREMEAGKPQKQAVAIAYSKARGDAYYSSPDKRPKHTLPGYDEALAEYKRLSGLKRRGVEDPKTGAKISGADLARAQEAVASKVMVDVKALLGRSDAADPERVRRALETYKGLRAKHGTKGTSKQLEAAERELREARGDASPWEPPDPREREYDLAFQQGRKAGQGGAPKGNNPHRGGHKKEGWDKGHQFGTEDRWPRGFDSARSDADYNTAEAEGKRLAISGVLQSEVKRRIKNYGDYHSDNKKFTEEEIERGYQAYLKEARARRKQDSATFDSVMDAATKMHDRADSFLHNARGDAGEHKKYEFSVPSYGKYVISATSEHTAWAMLHDKMAAKGVKMRSGGATMKVVDSAQADGISREEATPGTRVRVSESVARQMFGHVSNAKMRKEIISKVASSTYTIKKESGAYASLEGPHIQGYQVHVSDLTKA